jgi:hypothetical protein
MPPFRLYLDNGRVRLDRTDDLADAVVIYYEEPVVEDPVEETIEEEEVQVVRVIPAPGPPPSEVYPVDKDTVCPICFNEITDGTRVTILTCGANHFICSRCYQEMTFHDTEQQGRTSPTTLFEAVRRNEGADQCPQCRRMSHCSIEAIAQVF